MNRRMVFYVIGQIVKVEALLLFITAGIAALFDESSMKSFIVAAIIAATIGVILTFKEPENRVIYARDGFAIVAISWVFLSVIGSLPYILSGEIPNFIDALFESVNGFTTTGATILTSIDTLSKSILFWRSFTQWIGGMGVLVFVMSLIPLADNRSMHIMKAELSGPVFGKLVPKLSDSAKILYAIYIALTVVEIIILLIAGMPLYDSIVHSFSTAGTGGFSIYNESIAAYNSPLIESIIAVFMILFGVNYNLYYFMLMGNIKSALKSEELRCYLSIIFISIAVITINIMPIYQNVFEAVRYSGFHVASIISTTGYATVDFNIWPQLSRTILMLLMFCGSCAGSTGGGIKIARIVIFFKMMKNEFRKMLHPRSVSLVRFEGKAIADENLHSICIYLITYVAIACATILIISEDGFQFETNFTATLACLNNIGIGLDMVGATGNYSAFSSLSKLVLCFNMLLGRLEIFPVLLTLAPSIWRRK